MASVFTLVSCRPQWVRKAVQMSQESSFIALSIVVFLHEFLEPAMQDWRSEALPLHCLGKTDEGTPERFPLRDVVESSFN